jgi:4-hydroxybenzoyl-CoA thioesterase
VRFGDLDPAGVAYYPNLVHYLHVAMEDFFSGGLGRRYPDVIASGIGFPTVKLEIEYDAPVRFGNTVNVSVAIEHVGRTSLRVRYEGQVEGRTVFRARNVLVCVDMKAFTPVPIPAELRAGFEAAKG